MFGLQNVKTGLSLAGASPLQSGPFGTVSSSLLSFLASSSHLVPKDICIWKPWVGSWPCHLAEAVRSHLAIIDLHLAFTSQLPKEFPLMLSLDAFSYAFLTVTLLFVSLYR